jgi:hypothetical protein
MASKIKLFFESVYLWGEVQLWELRRHLAKLGIR